MGTYILVAFILLFINIYLHKKRIISINNLHRLYDKLEIGVIKNNLTPDKKLTTFLKINKAPIFNNHLLDFSFIFKAFKNIEDEEDYEKHKKGYADYLKTLPMEIQNITKEINASQNTIITLSLFKPINFILFIIILFPLVISSVIIYKVFKLFGVVISKLIKLPIAVKESYNNENIIVLYSEAKLYT